MFKFFLSASKTVTLRVETFVVQRTLKFAFENEKLSRNSKITRCNLVSDQSVHQKKKERPGRKQARRLHTCRHAFLLVIVGLSHLLVVIRPSSM